MANLGFNLSNTKNAYSQTSTLGNGVFVGMSTDAYYSTDGITWSVTNTIGNAVSNLGMSYLNNNFLPTNTQ